MGSILRGVWGYLFVFILGVWRDGILGMGWDGIDGMGREVGWGVGFRMGLGYLDKYICVEEFDNGDSIPQLGFRPLVTCLATSRCRESSACNVDHGEGRKPGKSDGASIQDFSQHPFLPSSMEFHQPPSSNPPPTPRSRPGRTPPPPHHVVNRQGQCRQDQWSPDPTRQC